MIRFPFIAALISAVILTACGTQSDNPLRALFSSGVKQIFSKKGQQEVLTTEILRARLTPDVLAQLGGSVMIAELPELKIASAVIATAQNGSVTTWFAPDGVAISTKGGMLLSTRGIGFDLMSSGVDEALAVVTGSGTGIATRTHRFLDGEDQEVLMRFECTYVGDKAHKPSYVSETCTTKGLQLENHYWLDKSGEILRSKQWAGTRNGVILLENVAG